MLIWFHAHAQGGIFSMIYHPAPIISKPFSRVRTVRGVGSRTCPNSRLVKDARRASRNSLAWRAKLITISLVATA